VRRADTSPPLTPEEVREIRRRRREAAEAAELSLTIQRAWSSARRPMTIEAQRAIQDIRRGGRR
jgi:hypothetical protein